MSASIDAFLAMLATERGAAANTLAAYRRDLAQAEEAIGDLADAGREAVANLSGEWASLAPASVARKASALRQFFGFAIDEGWRSDDPSGALPAPRARRPLPKVLGHTQIAALFARAEAEAAGDDPRAVRLLALIELLYGSGLRASELVGLPLSGWYAASRMGVTVSFFGIELPGIAARVEGAPGLIAELHETGGTAILILAGLHTLIALWHQFVRRDGTLARMTPL